MNRRIRQILQRQIFVDYPMIIDISTKIKTDMKKKNISQGETVQIAKYFKEKDLLCIRFWS